LEGNNKGQSIGNQEGERKGFENKFIRELDRRSHPKRKKLGQDNSDKPENGGGRNRSKDGLFQEGKVPRKMLFDDRSNIKKKELGFGGSSDQKERKRRNKGIRGLLDEKGRLTKHKEPGLRPQALQQGGPRCRQ